VKPLSEQVVVITGASSGIGRCAARHLAARGAKVVLFARSESALEEVRIGIEERGGEALVVVGDVAREEDVDELARRAVEAFGRIDTWVNNAAVFIQGHAEDIRPDEYRRVLDVNLLGTIYGTRRAIVQMKEQGEGVIVQVSSIVAERGAAYFSAYAASKRGVVGFTQSVRAELFDTDIEVSLLYLPSIDTPIYQHARGKFGTMPRPAPPVWEPIDAARAIADLAESGKPTHHVGTFHWVYRAPGLLSERLSDWFLHRGSGFTRTDTDAGADNLDEPSGPWRERGGWDIGAGWRGLEPREVLETYPVATKVAAGLVGLALAVALWRS
jgi:NAD(P)-dependent dehydrogenase (short-subunit alcohol dehydrogenase family)